MNLPKPMPSSDAEAAAFAASMPQDYRTTFDAEATALHAAIVGRRANAAVHVEAWRELEGTEVAVCLVADDRPGLLAQITTALVVLEIDVVEADAYCRRGPSGTVEAVDFLRLRRANGVARIGPSDLAAVASMLAGGRAATIEPDLAPPSRSRGGARLRFEIDPVTSATILSVEAFDRPGLLLAITKVLYRAGLQIVALHATTKEGRAIDRFHLVETDGSPLAQTRRFALQTALLVAIDESAGDVMGDR